MRRVPIKVTDHAALRYLQRVKGVDIDAVKTEMALRVEAAQGHPSCSAILCDGFRYTIRGGTIITVTRAKKPSIRCAGRVKDHPA